jgi:hypothetical protein
MNGHIVSVHADIWHACLSVGKRVALLERIQAVDAILGAVVMAVTLALLAAAGERL